MVRLASIRSSTRPSAYGVVSTASMLAAVFSMAWPAPACAQDGLGGIEGPPLRGSSEFMLGVGVANAPAYLGSDERKTRALPLIAARWSNGVFLGTGGIGWRFDTGTPLSWGLRLTFDPGRDEDDDDALRGMGDLEARAEVGAFASYRLLPSLQLGTSIRYGGGNDRDGLLADVSLRGGYPIAPHVRLTVGVTATYANARSMQSQFGVSTQQSLDSGYAIYTPGGGLRDVSVQVGSMFRLGSSAMLFVGANARTLMGDAVDSPLTRQRTGAAALATLAFRL